MADKQTERAIANLRKRHEYKLREMAESIQANAGYLLADLDHGNAPNLRNLLHDAEMIAVRIEALEAVNETAAIYESDGI